MVALVQEISQDPLGVDYKMLGEEDGFLQGMETTMLLQTINKIGGLMRVGFGEAGASVIAKNLKNSEGNRLDLTGAGTLIHSIFGFCDVRNFTDTTECLQEEVMLFVNRIAHILHSIVVQCSGSANKNIGDAFLLTWKIDDSFTPLQVSSLADQALLAFCKALIELCRYQDFICNFSIPATNRLYKRFPGYKVRIGSGLHVGWAIEGAIGSSRKIDASYLSPHVNMSEHLESSTKTYGVPLLMSEAFYRLLSPHANKYCRQVDRIKRSEGEEAFGLYTYDSDLNFDFAGELNNVARASEINVGRRRSMNLFASGGDQSSTNPNPRAFKMQKTKSMRDLEIEEKDEKDAAAKAAEALELEKNKSPTIKIASYRESVWETDLDVKNLRHLVNDSFRALWQEGMTAYIKGDWQKARDIFHETMLLSNGQDGPSKFLIKEIDDHGGSAPHDWQGYRDA
jgi:class 3 adenylate cyclase